MTRSVEIPEEAVEAAYEALTDGDIAPEERTRAAIEAALPYLAPAGDGGLGEALEQALESPVELWHENSFRVRALPETVLRELIAAHPAAPAVPQPTRRQIMDALGEATGKFQFQGRNDDWGRLIAAQADAVLAVLAGEQESRRYG